MFTSIWRSCWYLFSAIAKLNKNPPSIKIRQKRGEKKWERKRGREKNKDTSDVDRSRDRNWNENEAEGRQTDRQRLTKETWKRHHNKRIYHSPMVFYCITIAHSSTENPAFFQHDTVTEQKSYTMHNFHPALPYLFSYRVFQRYFKVVTFKYWIL